MQTLETKKLYQIADQVCKYLNLDENLFFMNGHIAVRLHEGRRYFCYVSAKEFNLDTVRVAKFLSLDTRTVKGHVENVRTLYSNGRSPQLIKDIDTITQNCKP